MLKKVLPVLLILSVCSCGLFANSADAANRRTAVRYLQLAKQYASQKKWVEAESQAKLGLAYDEKISDLWYVYAVSQANRSFPKADIISLVEKSINYNDWVDYNQDNANVLYADLMCSTLQFDKALSILGGEKLLYSADAEYIRCRCYYNLGGSENLARAREKIDSARRVYPFDVRFADIFFKYEYKLNEMDSGKRPESVQKIADAFIKMIPSYKNVAPELEVYAALFASGEARVRMLKSFNARGLKDPLYAVAALQNGLLTQEEALDYYLKFAENETDLWLLESMASLITEENTKAFFVENLNAWKGTVYADTDGDLVPNLSVKYVRGRAQEILYDENQDDVFDWTAQCDFGAPLLVHLNKDNTDVYYDNWPYVSKVENTVDSKMYFKVYLAAETMSYSPFGMKPDSAAKEFLGAEFFFPFVTKPFPQIDDYVLSTSALYYELPTDERKNSFIRFSVLDGMPQIIRYYENDVMYAQAQCENGIPSVRIVDRDGDGLFETTEFYGTDEKFADEYGSKDVIRYQSVGEERQAFKTLTGIDLEYSGIYLKMIQIDQNGDTIPDFTEEYTLGQGKITSWDFDNDGNWDTQYIRYPQKDGVLREESLFHEPFTHKVQSVVFENTKPVQVKDGDKILPVSKGIKNIYWIGKPGNDDLAKEILKQNYVQGVCKVVQPLKLSERVLVVEIGSLLFCQIIEGEEEIYEKVE